MRAFPRFSTSTFNASSLLPWLGHLATLLMLALLAWLCAGIYWTLTTPPAQRAAGRIETDPQRVVPAIVARHLFGIAPVTARPLATAPTDIKLSGVIAAQREGQTAYALLSVEGKPAQVVHEGDEFAPGTILKQVLPRAVEILRGGQSQTLSLPQPQSQPQPLSAPFPQASAPALPTSLPNAPKNGL